MKFHILFISLIFTSCALKTNQSKRPNILFVISDDQSFAHTSFAGSSFVSTPGFDRVAKEGIYFTNAYASSPGCAPSRSAVVTGRYPWQNEQSGQHASSWMKKYVPFIDELQNAGYATGRTGKGVEPFQYARNNSDSLWRKENAGGKTHSNIKYNRSTDNLPSNKISNINYFENFKYFLEHKQNENPFFFWYGGKEPHRAYEKGAWKKMGKKLTDVKVPEFLPDNDEIRGDLLDYAVEIEWFDSHLQKMLTYLESIGELENTIVIVTSDNGMPFPRAKANTLEYGSHVPLAIRFPEKFKGNRVINDLVEFVDFAPTIFELTQIQPKKMMPISGRSFVNLLTSNESGKIDSTRQYAFSSRERHSSSRHLNLGYPQRAIFSNEYAFIWNIKPERWPAGAPQKYDAKDSLTLLPLFGLDKNGSYISKSAFNDVDDSPTKSFLIEHKEDTFVNKYFDLAFKKRPEYELYHITKDPYCLNNLANNADYETIKNKMQKELEHKLKITQDPRVVGSDPEIFESYKRYSSMRKYPKPN